MEKIGCCGVCKLDILSPNFKSMPTFAATLFHHKKLCQLFCSSNNFEYRCHHFKCLLDCMSKSGDKHLDLCLQLIAGTDIYRYINIPAKMSLDFNLFKKLDSWNLMKWCFSILAWAGEGIMCITELIQSPLQSLERLPLSSLELARALIN